MTKFTHEGIFFEDLDAFMSYQDLDEKSVNELPDDWSVEACETEERPVYEYVDEENHPEDWTERWEEKVRKAIRENVDFEKLNNALPKLWYENGNKFKITKQELLNELK